MKSADSCDLAIWDVTGALSEDLVSRLIGRSHRRGPKISVDLGEWRDRRLAVARPRRLTAAALPTISQALRALVAAHDPAWLVVLGPASGSAAEFRVGDVVRHAGSALATPGEPIKVAELAQGSLDTGALKGVATAWSGAALAAAGMLETPTDLLALVCRVVEQGPIQPPRARPVTLGRELGGWVGRMIHPGTGRRDRLSIDTTAVTAALSVLLPRRPRRV